MIAKVKQKTGYATRQYADSLSEFGEILHVEHSDGYRLKRSIPGTPFYDAAGIYPLFCCSDWSRVKKDLMPRQTG